MYRYRHRCRTSALWAFVLAAMALSPRAATAQDQAAANPPAITVNARLVVLDVVVTGPNGKPVDDLSEKDFQVYEDGRLQRIRSFETPGAHRLPRSSLADGVAQSFDPAQPAGFGLSPVTVLLLDEANTHFADSSFARRQLHDTLAGLPAVLAQPTTLLSVYDGHFKQLQGFTRDRDALLRALAAAPTEYAWKLEIDGNTGDGPLERLDQSLRALETIAQDYIRIPGRKNLIWVGGGFPTPDPTALDGAEAQEVKDTLRHVTDVLLDTRITLYAVDPTSSAAGLTEITDTTQLAVAMAAGDSLTLGSDPFNATSDFDALGPITGGRVLRGRNDLSRLIAESVELGTNYYTLSYSPDSASQAEAAYRKIRIVCLRPGLTATTRMGYYAASPQGPASAEAASYDLTAAAESSVPLNGLHVTVEPGHAAASEASYIVRVPAPDLAWKTQTDGSSLASVYILAAWLNGEGKMVGHTTAGMKATARPGTDLRDPTRMASFTVAVPGPPRGRQLRFIVRDSGTGRMGSATLGGKTK